MLLHLPNRGSGGAFLDLSPLLKFDVLHALALTALGLTAMQLTVGRRCLPYLLLALLTLAGTVLADRSPWVGALPPWWQGFTADGRANPCFALERAGLTMALMVAAVNLQDRSPGRVASALAYFGRRSLGVYFIHLFLFFTEFQPGDSWASQVAARFSVCGVAGTTVLRLGFSLTLCWCIQAARAVIRAQNPLGEWAS